MLTSVLLTSASPGDAAPTWGFDVGGETVVQRLVRQVAPYGDVVVVGPGLDRSDVRPDLLDSGAQVVDAHGPAEVAAWLAEASVDEVLLLPADVIIGDLAVEHLADAAVAGTRAWLGPLGEPAAGLARTARGQLTSATSPYHRAMGADRSLRGALRVAATDRVQLQATAREVADLLAGAGPPAGLSDELERKLEVGDLGVPGVATAAPLDGDRLRDDLSAVLVVGLVRRGVDVQGAGLPPALPWRRPRSQEEAAAALDAVRATDEERVRLDAAVKAEDGFFTTFFVSSYSRYWARWCARRGLRPDQVTMASMVLGIVAAAAFAAGQRWGFVVGAVLLQLAFTLDCVDGQLARYTRRFSASGAWLDSIFDRGKEYVVYAGLAAGGVRAGDVSDLWTLASVALAIQVFRHMLDFGYAARQTADLRAPGSHPIDVVDEASASPWEAVGAPRGTAAGGRAAADGPARQVIGWLRSAERIAPLKWAKRIAVFPIGERFAVISLVTALVDPRATFWTLIVWGGLATTYTFVGRLVRSMT